MPSCPQCKSEMKLRTNRCTGREFWGCSTYPACRGTRPHKSGTRASGKSGRLTKEACEDGTLNCWHCPYSKARSRCFIKF
jgi:ssDNA-binding Zn-finger/Zn-ribbon topoisomerase 1